VLAQFLARTLAAAGIGARRARMTLPDDAAVSRHITLPPMSNRDLARAIRFEAERHLPIRIDRACWSWDVIERSAAGIQVYLVAAWRDVVQHYADVARIAGLEPEVLEPRSVAVARAVNQDRALLVDSSARRLHLTLLVGGQPVFTDDQDSGVDVADRQEALDRLLQRAFRYQTTAGNTRMAPVLLAGGLETAALSLPVAGGAVSTVLNGHLPNAPARSTRPATWPTWAWRRGPRDELPRTGAAAAGGQPVPPPARRTRGAWRPAPRDRDRADRGRGRHLGGRGGRCRDAARLASQPGPVTAGHGPNDPGNQPPLPT